MDAWLKGEFGKPFGSQPKLNPARTVCFAHLPQIWNLLWKIVNDEQQDAIGRGKLLWCMIEQACGKAPKSMEVKDTDGINPNMMSNEQLRLMAAGKMKELIFSVIQSGQIEDYIREHRETQEAGNTDISKASREDIKQLN